MTTAFNRFAAVLLNVAFNFSGAVPYLLATMICTALAGVAVITAPGIQSVVGSLMAVSPTLPNPHMEGCIQECS